jgi:hypothetical protein
MSVAAMTRLAVEAGADESPGEPPPVGTTPTGPAAPDRTTRATSASDPTTRVQAALEAIAAYIPSEALAVYLPALGIFAPREALGAWLVFGLGVLVVLLFTWLGLTKRQRKAKPSKGRVVYGLALTGFVLYAGALPGSPFDYLHDLAPKMLAFLALVAAFVMPEIAIRNGIRPRAA